MSKRPSCPFVKDVTRWAGSLHTRSTEDGTPSSWTQKDTFMLNMKWKQILRKDTKMSRYKLEVPTFVFVEYCEGGGRGVGVPQSHGPVCRAGEEALVCAAVHQTPDGVGVSKQRAAPHRWICFRKHKTTKVSSRDPTWKILRLKTKRRCYRRSRRGRCWDWGCSSTVWSRLPRRWNTAPLNCSSPHSVLRPWGSNTNDLAKRPTLNRFVFTWSGFCTCGPWKCRLVPHLKMRSCGQTMCSLI